MPRKTHSVAVVGGGPRCLVLLQHFCLRAASVARPRLSLTIFDPAHEVGAGRVYATDQSPQLRMNISLDNFSVFCEEFHLRYPEISISFGDWCLENSKVCEQPVVSRALVGEYLRHAAQRIISVADNNLVIEHVRSNVVQIKKHDEYFSVQTGEENLSFDYVAVATGHQGWYKPFEGEDNTPWVYPTHRNLCESRIAPGTTVTINGMALSAIDAIIEMTEGRGGTFTSIGTGLPEYSASGREPGKILLRSRSNRLILPKPAFEFYQRRVVESALNEGVTRLCDYLQHCQGRNQSIVFFAIEKILFSVADTIASELAGHVVDTELWLYSVWLNASFNFSCSVSRSLCEADFSTSAAAAAAGLGCALRRLQPAINDVADFGGFSYRDRLRYKHLNKRLEPIAFGAANVTARKILALIDLNLVSLSPTESAANAARASEHIIKAFLPPPGYEGSGEVLATLVEQGVVSIDKATMAVRTSKSGNALSSTGKETIPLGVFGRATEHWITGQDSLKAIHTEHIRAWVRVVLNEIGPCSHEEHFSKVFAEKQLAGAL